MPESVTWRDARSNGDAIEVVTSKPHLLATVRRIWQEAHRTELQVTAKQAEERRKAQP